MTFEIGQIFENQYPPEAAFWCNENGNAHIEEIDLTLEGIRRFQIVAAPGPKIEEIAETVRKKRNVLIADTDYFVMPDYPISAENLNAVKSYRQALRDVPEQEGFPASIVWPELPEVLKNDSK